MIANALGIFAPVITVVLFAVLADAQGSKLDEVTAFTTTATLAIVTHPANMIMTIVPRAVASFASFERIQDFLLEVSLTDERQVTSLRMSNSRTGGGTPSVSLSNVTVDNPCSASPLIRNVSWQLDKGATCIFCGPVGSGKSILAKAILGEVGLASGQLAVCSQRIAYCDQTAWLPSGTIKEIVSSFSGEVDETRYLRAICACCLDQEIASLPEGDATQVSSQGINLSGGQRQRLVCLEPPSFSQAYWLTV